MISLWTRARFETKSSKCAWNPKNNTFSSITKKATFHFTKWLKRWQTVPCSCVRTKNARRSGSCIRTTTTIIMAVLRSSTVRSLLIMTNLRCPNMMTTLYRYSASVTSAKVWLSIKLKCRPRCWKCLFTSFWSSSFTIKTSLLRVN